jgi:hypothetical protein
LRSISVSMMGFLFPSKLKNPTWPSFQGPSRSSVTRWVVFTCEVALLAPFALSFVLWGSESHSRWSITPDGSSPRLLTTSGMSSKDVYATDGRYGYVLDFDGLFWGDTVFFHRGEPRVDFLRVPWADILLYAPCHAHGCGHGTRHPQHDKPNQLSGVPVSCMYCLSTSRCSSFYENKGLDPLVFGEYFIPFCPLMHPNGPNPRQGPS